MENLLKGSFRMPEPMAPYLDKKFPTGSEKFEFMTEFEPSRLIPDDASYPYNLLTVAAHDYICSELTMAEHRALPEVRIHPGEAEKAGVTDGGSALLKSKNGSIKVMVKTDIEMRKDCIVAFRGGWIKAGHGLNQLTDDIASSVGDGTPFYGTRVKLVSC